jgi:hypothetical protein
MAAVRSSWTHDAAGGLVYELHQLYTQPEHARGKPKDDESDRKLGPLDATGRHNLLPSCFNSLLIAGGSGAVNRGLFRARNLSAG